MGIPVVTREYTPRAWRNSRKPMRLPLRHEMRPDSPNCMQSNCVFPIKHIRSLDLLDWTVESPQQHLTRREHWCHLRNAELIGVPQINSRWSTFPIHWIHSRLLFHIIYNFILPWLNLFLFYCSDAIVNGIAFLISSSDSLMLVYRNGTDFCLLILSLLSIIYPVWSRYLNILLLLQQ